MIAITERQLHAMLFAAVAHKQAFVVKDTNLDHLREICRAYDGIEVVAPLAPVPSHDQQITLVRLMQPSQRERAMVMPYWPDIPKPLLARVIQLRLVDK